MAKSRKPRASSGGYTLGRGAFAKISEVEGLAPSRGLEEDGRAFDRQDLSPTERRRALARKYGGKADRT